MGKQPPLSPEVFQFQRAHLNRIHSTLQSTVLEKLGDCPRFLSYPWVDLQPNLKIHSIYSTKIFEPIEFIARDLEVARLRRERLTRFQTSEAAGNPALEAAFLESLEAELPYNCEHVVPQSWFQKRQPMKGELHHLFACESKCNSFRGKINSTASEYTPNRIQTILQWHQDHPVSEYERHRNQAIFAVQGNRNPLVDQPDWSKNVNFPRGID